jgi:iron complex outermembrane receptor protein
LYKPDSNANNRFVFSAGRRISRPDYQSLNPSIFFFDRNTSLAGNSLLQPQFSTNFELSYSIGDPLMVSLLYSNTDNAITTGYKQVENTFVSTQVNIHRFVSAGISASSSMQVSSWWSVNLYTGLISTSFKGALFGGEAYINNQLLSFQLSGSSQFKFGKGWSADITGVYRSRQLSAQSLREPGGQIHAGLQKKFNDRVSLSLAARDIFYSWRIKRTVTILNASVLYDGRNDTRQIGLTFTRRFGKQVAARERRTGIQSESERL